MGKKIANVETPAETSVHTPVRAKAPRRPINSYLRFVQDLYKAMPDSAKSVTEFSRIAGAKWRDLTPAQREKYVVTAAAAMIKWKEERPEPLPFPSKEAHALTALMLFKMRTWYAAERKVRKTLPADTPQSTIFPLVSDALHKEWQHMSDAEQAPYIVDHIEHRKKILEERARGTALARAGVADKAPEKVRRVRAAKAVPEVVVTPVAPAVAPVVEKAVRSEKKARKERRKTSSS